MPSHSSLQSKRNWRSSPEVNHLRHHKFQTFPENHTQPDIARHLKTSLPHIVACFFNSIFVIERNGTKNCSNEAERRTRP